MIINKDLETDENSSMLSFVDLFINKEFKEAYHKGDMDTVSKLLHLVGVDVSQGIQVVTRLHRPMSMKEAVKAPVVFYIERLDEEWIKGGAASMDAVVRSTRDPDTRSVLTSMQDAYLTYDKQCAVVLRDDRGVAKSNFKKGFNHGV